MALPVLSLLGVVAVLGAAPIHVDGEQFKDAHNRVVVLRGVNVAGDVKVPPFTSLRGESLRPLSSWGVNVIRLLFTWEAFEPEAGHYNRDYLAYYTDLVRRAAAEDLYVIVDFHQDGMSRYLSSGCGDGFPGWAVPAQIVRSAPDNGVRCANWPLRVAIDTDMHAAWRLFYRNTNNARQRFVDMTHLVAAHLAGETNVVGYDMLNEPWGDEATEVAELYKDTAVAIHSASPSSILFVSPHAIVSSGVQTDLPKPAFDNVAYAPHFYDNWVMAVNTWVGNSLDWSFARMRSKAAEWHVPLFVGEFGAPARARRVEGFMQTLHERLDEGVTSGAQWCYTPGWTPVRKDGWNAEDLSIVDHEGTWRPNFKPRPYPQKVAGTPIALSVYEALDVHNNLFDFSWDNDPEAGSTDIFMPTPVFLADEPMQVNTTGPQLKCTSIDGGLRLRCASPVAGPMRVRVGVHLGYAADARR